jgi:hypothetical protein
MTRRALIAMAGLAVIALATWMFRFAPMQGRRFGIVGRTAFA